MCHFKNLDTCSNTATHGWTFLAAYIVFSISVLNFLSMCESAVFTVATATVSLPLSGIWWSIYKMDVSPHGGEFLKVLHSRNFVARRSMHLTRKSERLF